MGEPSSASQGRSPWSLRSSSRQALRMRLPGPSPYGPPAPCPLYHWGRGTRRPRSAIASSARRRAARVPRFRSRSLLRPKVWKRTGRPNVPPSGWSSGGQSGPSPQAEFADPSRLRNRTVSLPNLGVFRDNRAARWYARKKQEGLPTQRSTAPNPKRLAISRAM